ncbi:hypothetical protein VD0002_g8825 [Verticillium dahliae]|uniref:Uncharacterized protein n=2 Tax=Verticillium dahliae TaxID=27337 RepID=G2XAK1_VERDV|nr:uncharacterized protein VDAG_07281 [Verticillium dahliae VdLs.17]KAH6687077.1 hypothetical protein EV126DRAFT_133631 [Verticillium dahliae]EGY16117.1 hypothetical protein VDAG_07281 [Verticillium dahliae VdLs.17]PNH30137.1 hypothetical protein BJF96_g6562 [Verticillium dahliae]PNH47138.1 hypothetical protein VD0004_g1126 [Verticillium dahliae]PNH55515.1 hypothetical protein VD0003_g2091 [Verticillium dahliae]
MPDLNSVPASPHALTSSRRPSSNQLPAHNLDILPSNQTTVNQPRRASNASLPSPHLPPGQPQPTTANISAPSDIGVVSGPGPIRHPRPLTAADLHIQLEKEQEAVVNRLTRELQLLRAAHNASTVSNASSTSTGNTATEQPTPPVDAGLLSGAGFSTAGRRHNRTSSSTSARSLMATMGSANASTTSIPMRSAPNASLSRQNSSASHPSLAGTSPAAADLIAGPGYFPSSQRVPSQVATSAGTLATPAGQEQQQQPLSPSHVPGTVRYEETLLHREQLETALQENEALKRRIRELERLVRERRRSESVSTTGGPAPQRPGGDRERSMTAASMGAQSIAGSVGVGVPEEEVKVGESASNAGLAQGV